MRKEGLHINKNKADNNNKKSTKKHEQAYHKCSPVSQ